MNRNLVIAGIACALMSLAATAVDPTEGFTIKGQFLPDKAAKDEENGQPSVGNLEARVVIFRKVLNEHGESETLELASDSFVNNEVSLSGKIEKPTDSTISVAVDGRDPLTTNVVLNPGDDLLFRVLTDDSGMPDEVMFVGNLRLHEDPSRKFTIKGDLRSLDVDLRGATVNVLARGDGNVGTLNFGSVIVANDGTFKIENASEEPRAVWITVKSENGFNSNPQAILEPRATITVIPDDEGSGLIATSDGDMHKALIESWSMNEEYLSLTRAHRTAKEEYQNEMAVRQEEAKLQEAAASEETGGENTSVKNESEAVETDKKVKEQPPILALALGIPPVVECEHVNLDQVKPGIMDYVDATYPQYFKLQTAMTQFRYREIEKVATTSNDPVEALLALELDAFGILSNERYRALDVYDQVASRLNADMVARRLEPLRSKAAPDVERRRNDRNLVPGQKAPEFTLKGLDGEEVSLRDALEVNELVLVEFWASWCGPCIRKFPALKRLYAAYHDRGFQVVTIDTDDSLEKWALASEEHQLPWIDIGELDDESNSPVATSYGVTVIPKGYIVDKKGCVIQKDLKTDMLTEYLVETYGEISQADEDEIEKVEGASPG